MHDHPDKQILEEKNPDRRMRLIIRHYGPKLYSVIRPIVKTHEDANDVMQETLTKIHLNLDKFQGKSRLFTWMYRIAKNESLRFLKKKYATVDDGEFMRELLENLRSDPWFSGDEAAYKLEQALLQLPPRQAEVFRLRYFSEMKYREMSELLGLTEGALKTHYHLAVQKIKEFLEGDFEF